jgi:O-antigen/teichoic acid export membrane protein
MLPYLVSFITLPVYSRFLTPDDYGILALVASFSALLTPIITLQLRVAIGRHYFDHKGEDLRQFFSTIFFSVAVIGGLGILLTVVLGGRFTDLVFPKAQIPFFPFFALGLVTMFFSELAGVVHLLLVVMEKGHLILTRALASTVLGLGLGLWFVVVMKMGAVGPLLAGACAAAVNTLLGAYLVREYFTLRWRKDFFRQSLRYSLPIVPHAFGGYLFMYSDQLVMEKFLPLASIGLYSIADRFSRILKTFVNSVSNSLSPNFMRLAKGSRDEAVGKFRGVMEKWAVLIGGAYLTLALFSEEALLLLTPPQYHAAYTVVPVLLVAYVFRGLYCFASYPLFFLKNTKVIPIITVTAGCTNVILNILFIPRFGVMAAAWTTVFSFAMTFALACFFSRKVMPMDYPWATFSKVLVFTALCVAAAMAGRTMGTVPGAIIKAAVCLAYAGAVWATDTGDIRGDVRGVVAGLRSGGTSRREGG